MGDDDLANGYARGQDIGGLASRRDREGKISEVPEHRHLRFRKTQRPIALLGAVEHVGIMRREHRRHEEPGIDQRDCRECEVPDPLAAIDMPQGRQWLDDCDQAQQRGGDDENQDKWCRGIFFDVARADLLRGQACHPCADQNQEKRNPEIPAHQEAGDQRPLRRQNEKHRDTQGQRDPEPGMFTDQFLHGAILTSASIRRFDHGKSFNLITMQRRVRRHSPQARNFQFLSSLAAMPTRQPCSAMVAHRI